MDILTPTSERKTGSRAALDRDQDGAMIARPVLAAVDVSWDLRAALLRACKHAANVDVPMMVRHVLHDSVESPGKYSHAAPDALMPMADMAKRMLSEFMAEVRENHPELNRLAEACTRVLNGLPGQTIVDEAVRLKASLIVMGNRGHTGLPGLMYGSTAQKVVRLSQIPVTVVKDQRG